MAAMNNRERLVAALNHQETDRVPIDFGGCYATTIYFTAYEKLKAHLGFEHETLIGRRLGRCALVDESILRHFDVDTRLLSPGGFEGPGNSREIDEDTFADELGAIWYKVGDGPYLNVDGPFFDRASDMADLENHDWPDTSNPGYTRGLRQRALELRENTPGAIVLNLPSGVVHTGQWLRGYDTWLIDLYKKRDFACRLMDLIADWWVGITAAALDEVGDLVDVVNLGDDLGTQASTVIDPEIYRQLVKPRHQRMFEAVKSRTEAKLQLHSCGSVSALFDDFIDVGVDCVNPIQVNAADMDPEKLKAEYGDRLAFWGAIDTQQVLPFGSPDEVRSEVRRIIEILGPGGGYVLNSVHNIQPDVPPENVVAMFDEARNYRASWN